MTQCHRGMGGMNHRPHHPNPPISILRISLTAGGQPTFRQLVHHHGGAPSMTQFHRGMGGMNDRPHPPEPGNLNFTTS